MDISSLPELFILAPLSKGLQSVRLTDMGFHTISRNTLSAKEVDSGHMTLEFIGPIISPGSCQPDRML